MAVLTKQVNFRVDPEKWAGFEKVASVNGVEHSELLRELIAHADSAYRAIKAGQIASLDGDVAGWLTKEFPQLPPAELRLFAAVLASAADRIQDSSKVRG